jgi:sugar lactone lactonase YvrE
MKIRALPAVSRHLTCFGRRWSGMSALLLGLLPALVLGQTDYTPYTFTTLASRASVGSEDGTGSAARFNSPQGVTVDSSGNVYVADTGNHTIRRVTPRHVVTTIAGSPGQPGSADGIGAAARFDRPYAMALDGFGTLYIADTGNHTIRKITPEGAVMTLAGSPGQPGNADGDASAARFFKPAGLTVDAVGNLYIADSGNNAVRKITPAGVVTTLADSSAGLDEPRGIAVDAVGNVFVGSVGRLWMITAAGVLTPLAGGGYGVDDGVGSAAGFEEPVGLALDGAGILWAADGRNIRRITPAAVVTTTAYADERFGGAGDAASDPQFGAPVSLAVDATGYLYFADVANTIHRMPAGSNAATMLAGFPGQRGDADGSSGGARFIAPRQVTADSAGNLYVTDGEWFGARVRQVRPDGGVSTLAGGGNEILADGTGTAASFFGLDGIAADRGGNLYVTDSFYHLVRKITTPAGVVTTLATQVGDLNNFVSARMAAAVDAAGNIYVAVYKYHIIQKISPAGTVSAFAGSRGQPGSADGTGSDARFNAPYALATDRDSNLYVLDASNAGSVRRITPAGMVTTVATGVTLSVEPALFQRIGYGPITTDSPRGIAVDGTGNIFLTYYYLHVVRRISTSGAVTTIGGVAGEPGSADGTGGAARFNGPDGIAVDNTGNLYLVDAIDNTIRKGQLSAFPVVTAPPVSRTVSAGQNAVFSVMAGSSSEVAYRWQRRANGSNTWTDLSDNAASAGTATDTLTVSSATASMTGDSFRCLVTNGSGSVISDAATLAVIGGTPLTVSTFAGQAGISGSADGTRRIAHFVAPADLAVDGAGNVYVADTDNHVIREIASGGMVTTLAGMAGSQGSADGTGSAARFAFPAGVTVDGTGTVYVADTGNHTIRRITPTGVVTTLAGEPGASGTFDGSGAAARFNGPSGVAVDATGNLYVADTLNHAIRKVTQSGVVSTPAGAAGWSGRNDGTGGQVRFYGPQGLALDGADSLYVADTNNCTIRKVVLSTATVTTVAGQPARTGSDDGPVSQAQFNYPSAVAVDRAGNLYVVDTDNHVIRQITPAGVVTTIAGLAGASGSADGVGTAARFNFPTGIAADDAGNLYIADSDNHTIRVAYFAAVTAITAQPASQTVTAGGNAQFSVTASGKPAPTYQWFFNGAAVSGATSNTLSLANVQPANAGSYTVTVTNDSGSATSNAATLTVNAATTGSSGGGGAMEVWFVLALVLLGIVHGMARGVCRPWRC